MEYINSRYYSSSDHFTVYLHVYTVSYSRIRDLHFKRTRVVLSTIRLTNKSRVLAFLSRLSFLYGARECKRISVRVFSLIDYYY